MLNKAFTVSFIILLSQVALAQFQIPLLDVEVKASENLFPGNDNPPYTLRAIETTNLHLAAHVQINQHIAIGWIYSSSMRGSGFNDPNDFKFNFGGGDSKALTLFTGPDIRLSAGRAVRWRPYLSVNYCKAQIVEDKVNYRLADNTSAIGGSFGLMRRMGNHLYWNVFEIGGKVLQSAPFWSQRNAILDIKTGFTYNMGKRK
jgi:hypothetical protein